jgi:hypothetical protein
MLTGLDKPLSLAFLERSSARAGLVAKAVELSVTNQFADVPQRAKWQVLSLRLE